MCHLNLMNTRRKSDIEMQNTRLNFREPLSVCIRRQWNIVLLQKDSVALKVLSPSGPPWVF